jgi:hypothetical protein
MVTVLPGGLGELQAAYAEFQAAPDKASAQAALARLTSAAGGLHQAVRVALQEELPAPGADAAEAAAEPGGGDAAVAGSSEPKAADPAPPDPRVEAVKQEAKSLIKRKVRLP